MISDTLPQVQAPSSLRISRKQLEAWGAVLGLILAGGNLNDALGGDSLINRSNQAILVGLYFCAVLLGVKRYQSLLRAVPRDALTFAIPVLALLSCTWSTDPEGSIPPAVVLSMSVASSVYVGLRFDPAELAQIFVVAMKWAVLLNLIVVIALPGYGIMSEVHEGAWQGFYSHKNTLARTMALAIPVLLAATMSREWRNTTTVGALAGAVVLLLGAGSATGITVAAFLVLFRPAMRLFRTHRTLVVPLLVGLSVTVVALAIGVLTILPQFVTALDRDITLTGRTVVWAIVIQDVLGNIALGHGYRGYWRGWDGPSSRVWAAGPWNPNDSHNGVLDILLDFGALGLLLMSAHLVGALRRTFGFFRYDGSAAAYVMVVVVLHFVLYNLTESSVFRPTNMLWLGYLMVSVSAGAALARGNQHHEMSR